MNVSRQPFVVSALLALALGAVCIVGRTGGATGTAAMWALSAAAGVMAVGLIVQMAIRMAPGAGRNYLPVQVFVVAACAAGVPSPTGIIAAMFVAAAMRRAAMAGGKQMKMENVFRAGLWFGLAALLYAPAAAVAAAMTPATLLIYKRSAREWIIALVGLLLPFGLAAFGWWAVADESFAQQFWSQIATQNNWLTTLTPRTVAAAATMAAVGVVAAMGGLAGRKALRSGPRRWMVAGAALLGAGLAALAVPGCGSEMVPVVGVGAACSVPYGFSGRWSAASTGAWMAMLIAATVGLAL